jgi:hypothetical protein
MSGMGWNRKACLLALSLAAVAAIPAAAQAQEDSPAAIQPAKNPEASTFWFASEGIATPFQTATVQSYVAEIVDITDRGVSYRDPQSSQLRQLQGDYLVALDIAWGNQAARNAWETYQRHDFEAFPKQAAEILKSTDRIPGWQEVALVGLMSDALQAGNRIKAAGNIYLNIAGRPLPSYLVAYVPLAWTIETPDAETEKAALEWMQRPEELAQLMGASWLLTGKNRAKSEELLKALSKSRSRSVRSLATAQLWRTAPAAEATSQQLPDWTQARDQMLFPLQLGPTIVIADKLDRAGQGLQAVPEWLRIAIVHRDRYDAASKAAGQAARALRQSGREAEAASILKPFDTDQDLNRR